MAWTQIAELTGPQGATGPPGVTILADADDYDNTTPATDRQAILWVAAGGKFKPQTIQLADVSGLVSGLAGKQPLDSDLTTIAGLTVVNDSVMQGKAGAWAVRTPAQLKTDLALAKADVGLGSVDNTTDAAKPVSTAQQTALDAKQPLDADLTTIAGLTATTDSVMQAKAGAWSARTLAQLRTDLALQPLDSDLTTIAGLTPTTDSFLQAKSSAWTTRTIAQVKTDLGIAAADLAVFNSIRVLSAYVTSDHTLTQAVADLGGASVTFTTFTANAIAVVQATYDFRLTVLGTGYCYGEFAVDGTTNAKKALFVHQSVETRVPGSYTVPVTLASTGSHTIKLQGHKDAADGTGTAYFTGGSVTGLVVTVYDRNF